MLQTKILGGYVSLIDLEKKINNFLKTIDQDSVKEIKFIQETRNFYPIVMIVYESEE